MINKKDIGFDFNDILIIPKETTTINSRDEVNPYDENNFLPIFAAPMDTVVNIENHHHFLKNKINVCLPRNEKVSLFQTTPHLFKSVSLIEAKELLLTNSVVEDIILSLTNPVYVLIDIANGHMKDLVTTIKKIKKLYDNKIVLMVGNIANPDTYEILSNAGADLIRCSIGTGNGCTTAANGAISYPLGSLIYECRNKSFALDNPAKIVADGGMKNYSDIIKALALGADYVMVGSLLNKSLESAGGNYILGGKIKINKDLAKWFYNRGFKVIKKFRGMSTKEVQREWGKKKLRTSEGVVRYRKVEYTLDSWTENLTDYLKSAMSYTNSRGLNEFIGEVKVKLITMAAFNRFNK
jgi:GMP reductase